MIRNLALAFALVAGLFAFSPRGAEAAPLPAAVLAGTLAAPSDAAVTQVGWYGRRHFGYHRHFGYRRHFGPRFGWRHRGYGYGYRRHFGPRFGYRHHHFGRRFYRY